jgi:serine/threonine protein kinase
MDLLKKLLEKEPAARITAIDALRHPWFVDVGANGLGPGNNAR